MFIYYILYLWNISIHLWYTYIYEIYYIICYKTNIILSNIIGYFLIPILVQIHPQFLSKYQKQKEFNNSWSIPNLEIMLKYIPFLSYFFISVIKNHDYNNL